MKTTFKGQFTDNETGEKYYQNITGEQVIITGFESIGLAVHGTKETGFTVSETSCGLKIAHNKNKKLAILDARDKMKHVGIDAVKACIDKAPKPPIKVTWNVCRSAS